MLFSPIRSKMAHVLDLLRSSVPLTNVYNWLQTAQESEDLALLKNHSISNHDFPFMLITFIKDQTERILKENNNFPEDVRTPKKEVAVVTVVEHPSLTTPKIVETRKIRKKLDQSIDLQNETAFPPLQKAGGTPQPRDVQRKRRINPTQLSGFPEPAASSIKFGSSFSISSHRNKIATNPFNQAKEQLQHKNLDHERELLKELKKQPLSPAIEMGSSQATKTLTCLEPDIALVTEARTLDRLSALYSFCLSRNFVPAFFTEVKFLLELLLLRISPLKHRPGQGLLSSVHDCVYLASQTLGQLDGWWECLDDSTLNLLVENPRLAIFCPDVASKMSTHVASLTESNCRTLSNLQPTIGNVAFQSETDNRFNFASDSSFHTFRKQRDQFCEMWQIWKQNCSSPEWNMALALQKRIQSLVDLKRDCVNYVHLARLFRSQLLKVARLVDDIEEPSGPLGLLQSSDPVKLRRLRERLINPPEGRGRDGIVFEGDQEFFRDFILLANSTAFNEHLKNCLVSDIEDLYRNAIADSSREDCETEGRDAYHLAETVVSLRVLAKFLAFLTFQPHELSDHLPEHIFHELSQLRGNQKPPIDLLLYIDEAVHRGQLVITLPWIVTFLSMADPVSLRLPSYHPILCYFVWIYKTMLSATPLKMHGRSVFLIRVLLSWFFEQNSFPRSLLIKKLDELWSEVENVLSERKHAMLLQDPCLDELAVVDSRFLYQCCSFLWSWKTLLANFADKRGRSGEKGPVGHRKITPVSAENPSQVGRKSQQRPVKSLQLQLEESFFHNQPSSVKRTVDFVSDRLASNVIRDVRQRVIPSIACRGQESVKAWPRKPLLADGQRVDEQLDSLSGQLCQDVRRETSSLLAGVTTTSILDSTLAVLLAKDVLPSVRQVCVAVTVRLTHEKVFDWTERHVTLVLFKNDLASEWSKKENAAAKPAGPPGAEGVVPAWTGVAPAEHDASTWSPSMLLDHVKKLICDIMHDDTKLTSADVMDVCVRLTDCLERRCDVTPLFSRCVQQLSYDFLFTTCVFQPEVVTSEAILLWVDFWRRVQQPAEAEAVNASTPRPCVWLIFSPRQLLLLAQSTSPRLSWTQLTSLVLHLLKSSLIQYQEVAEQAVSVLRQNWPKELLDRFATCLQDMVDWKRAQKLDVDTALDTELLSWLSWFCSQPDLP